MDSVLGYLSVPNFWALLKIGMWLLIFLIIGACLFAMTVLVLIKSTQQKVIEINMLNRRMKFFNGRLKSKGKGNKQFWASKIKRWLPKFQERSIYLKGKSDVVILLKDNNGMYHTARIPTYSEMKKWYKVVYNIDIVKDDLGKRIGNIYLLPNPHEDLDWLSSQCIEADKEFKPQSWWQSPVVAYVATGFICMMMIIMTLIIEKKF